MYKKEDRTICHAGSTASLPCVVGDGVHKGGGRRHAGEGHNGQGQGAAADEGCSGGGGGQEKGVVGKRGGRGDRFGSQKRGIEICKRDGEEIHKEMDFSATPSLVHTHIFILYKINLHGIIYNQSIINPLYTFYEYTTEYPILPKSPEFVSFYLYDIFHVIYLILFNSPPQSQLI
jgi:hypothetical protein